MSAQRYRHEDMYDYGCRVLERLDVPAGDAADVCGCLTKAELRSVIGELDRRTSANATRV